MSARIEAAARAIHDASGFDPDGIVWPCEACMTRAKVALAAADAVAASELEATRAALSDLANRCPDCGGSGVIHREGWFSNEIPEGHECETCSQCDRCGPAREFLDAARAAVVSHPPEAER